MLTYRSPIKFLVFYYRLDTAENYKMSSVETDPLNMRGDIIYKRFVLLNKCYTKDTEAINQAWFPSYWYCTVQWYGKDFQTQRHLATLLRRWGLFCQVPHRETYDLSSRFDKTLFYMHVKQNTCYSATSKIWYISIKQCMFSKRLSHKGPIIVSLPWLKKPALLMQCSFFGSHLYTGKPCVVCSLV